MDPDPGSDRWGGGTTYIVCVCVRERETVESVSELNLEIKGSSVFIERRVKELNLVARFWFLGFGNWGGCSRQIPASSSVKFWAQRERERERGFGIGLAKAKRDWEREREREIERWLWELCAWRRGGERPLQLVGLTWRGLIGRWVWVGLVWGWLWDLPLFFFNFFFGGFVFFFFGRKFFFGGFIIQTDRERKRMRCFYQKKRWRRKEISHRFATSLAVPNGPFRFFNPPSYNNTNTIPLILYYYYFYYCWETNIFIIIFTSSKWF